MKKYFDFNGTISGTNYFLRGLANSIVIGALTGLNEVGALIASIGGLWFALSTITKRVRALADSDDVTGRAILFSLGMFIPFVNLILGLYLTFANSTKTHEG